MKKDKKFLAILLCVLLPVTSFIACGQRTLNKDYDGGDRKTNGSSESPVATLEQTPEASVEISPTAAPKTEPQETPANEPKETPKATLEAEATPDAASGIASSPGTSAAPEATAEASGKNEVDAEKAFGFIKDTRYTNEFFKFTVDLPPDWNTADREQLLAINQLGADFIKESGGNSSAIDRALTQMIPLFFVSRHPLDYLGGTNASINALALNMGITKSLIKGPKNYLEILPQSMKAKGLDYTLGEITELNIGGRDFAKADAVLITGGMEIPQTLYVALAEDYALTLSLNYFSDEEKQQLEDIVKSFSFK